MSLIIASVCTSILVFANLISGIRSMSAFEHSPSNKRWIEFVFDNESADLSCAYDFFPPYDYYLLLPNYLHTISCEQQQTQGVRNATWYFENGTEISEKIRSAMGMQLLDYGLVLIINRVGLRHYGIYICKVQIRTIMEYPYSYCTSLEIRKGINIFGTVKRRSIFDEEGLENLKIASISAGTFLVVAISLYIVYMFRYKTVPEPISKATEHYSSTLASMEHIIPSNIQMVEDSLKKETLPDLQKDTQNSDECGMGCTDLVPLPHYANVAYDEERKYSYPLPQLRKFASDSDMQSAEISL